MPTIEEKTNVMQKLQLMAAAEFAFKSPLIPLFQRGNFFFMTQTPPFDELRAGFWKRGERGDLCAEGAGNNAMDLRAGMLDRYCL